MWEEVEPRRWCWVMPEVVVRDPCVAALRGGAEFVEREEGDAW
jgi:hypothetical protein